jgi:hypothetical protein
VAGRDRISGTAERQVRYGMAFRRSALDSWSPEQVALGRAWAATWRDAGPRLEAIRRQELRELDPFAAIALLCGTADYHQPPRAPSSTSGLIEQQRLFMRLRRP